MNKAPVRQFVLSNLECDLPAPEGSVFFWKAIISNPEEKDGSQWEIHVLARNIADAYNVACSLSDTKPEIVTSIVLVGAFGIYASPDIVLEPSSQNFDWQREHKTVTKQVE